MIGSERKMIEIHHLAAAVSSAPLCLSMYVCFVMEHITQAQKKAA
jgi:hypothetical protein